MRKTNKKGFTIVELVIVIAVIAILAAVLIPTYSSLVKKANVSADVQAVKQMNTALAIYTAENGKPKDATAVKKALDENLINAESLIPVTQGYAFYWDDVNNKIVLVGDGKAEPKESWSLLSSTGYGEKKEVSSAEELKNAISASTNVKPALITLTSDISLEETLEIKTGNCVVIDLNNKTITKKNATYSNLKEGTGDVSIIKVSDGTLTVKNGTIGDTSTFNLCVSNEGGDVTLNGVKMYNYGTGKLTKTEKNGNEQKEKEEYYPVVKIDGLSSTFIIGCTLESTGYDAISTNSSKAESDGSRITIVDSTLTGKYAGILITTYADVTIEGSTFTGEEHGAFFRGCNAKISNSTFKATKTASAGAWKSDGNRGPAASICFASGGSGDFSSYTATANYVCENVTVDKVVVHEPEGGKVTVTGIEMKYHTCHGAKDDVCNEDSTCGD